MSISESSTPAKSKRKPARKVAAKPSTKPDELAGITVTACPTACNAQGCVISGHGICSHPHKGGLQGRDQQNPAALARLSAAKRILGKKLIDLRNP